MASLLPNSKGYIHLLLICLLYAYVLGESCPQKCQCASAWIDCSFKGFTTVPSDIDPLTRKLDLQGNNLTDIKRSDFASFSELRSLSLSDNNIQNVESGAFDDLVSLQTLSLNRNQLRDLPRYLFTSLTELKTLDLSNNLMQSLEDGAFSGLSFLTSLQLDNNKLSCIDERVFRDVPYVRTLFLNNNNLTRLAIGAFDNLNDLRILRLSENRLVCDCNIAWLARWLRVNTGLARFAKCDSPAEVARSSLNSVALTSFTCPDGQVITEEPKCVKVVYQPCPARCTCLDGVVTCKDLGLNAVPAKIPTDTVQLRLEQNQITRLSAADFAGLTQLQTLDLSFNKIVEISEDAFSELTNLKSLFLFENEIEELPPAVFSQLNKLGLLLLNSNKIKCVHVDLFQGLERLNLLSLFDNQIKTLANGTFSRLQSLQNLHLGTNPFHCDCELMWLTDYLKNMETARAKCDTPSSLRNEEVAEVANLRDRCAGWKPDRRVARCQKVINCPADCECIGATVDCTEKGLLSIPSNIPESTEELLLSDNYITDIGHGAFSRLRQLRKLDLSRNMIRHIVDGAFRNLDSLSELQLTNNKIKQLRRGMFEGIPMVQTLMLRENSLTCVDNRTLTALPNLRLLSLYGNKITCIQPGSFDALSQLSTLSLMSNPLNCDCEMRWFTDWLEDRQQQGDGISAGSPTCEQPRRFKGQAVNKLVSEQMVCPARAPVGGCQVQMPECCSDAAPKEECSHPPIICPDGCTCTGTVVDCQRMDLTEVPVSIPAETTELFLGGNLLTAIPAALNRLVHLRSLDLSGNRITAIRNGQFSNLHRLKRLLLAENRIKCIHPEAFSNLESLQLLNLYSNNISTIPYASFRELADIRDVVLGNNPLWCDCNLKWLAEKVRSSSPSLENGIAKCEGPEGVRNQRLLNTPLTSFQCPQDYDDSFILQKCNACISNPCENNAQCITDAGDDFTCQCRSGFYGPRCQLEIDACFGNPCENNGVCSDDNGRITCTCQAGFEGVRCQTNKDDCLDHACENGATCIDLIQTYQCICPLGFSGKLCEESIDLCAELSPCLNGATCTNQEVGYTCRCVSGYTGDNCTTNIDDCTNHLCQNGARCVDGMGNYTCDCPTEYSGNYCQARKSSNSPQSTSVCQNSECLNGAVCYQPLNSNEYQCRCTPGYEGKKCEKLTSLKLTEGSYIQASGEDSNRRNNITMIFSTEVETGVLLYQGQSRAHFSVSLFRGLVRVTLNLNKNNSNPLILFSSMHVSDGSPHTLSLVMERNSLTLTVDSISNSMRDPTNLVLPAANLYLGGIPSNLKSWVEGQYQVESGESFKGCLQAVYKNGQKLDFSKSSFTGHQVIPGCGLSDPCKNHLCKTGKCVANHETMSYTCRCRKNYTGTFCDTPPVSCKSETTREYIVDDNGCRSHDRIKLKSCLGERCEPQNYRKKSIKMKCENGGRVNSYTKQIDVVGKCRRTKRKRSRH